MATCRCIVGVSNDRKAESNPDNRSICPPRHARRARGCHLPPRTARRAWAGKWWWRRRWRWLASSIPVPAAAGVGPAGAREGAMDHPDLAAEQAYIDDAYRCLAAMQERTARAAAISDSAAQEVDSAIAQAHLRHRLASPDPHVPAPSLG